MKRRTNDFALGLTTLVVLALLVGTVLFLRPLFQDTGRTLTIHFPHDKGMAPLEPGSAVLLGGSVGIGRVRDVRISEVDAPAGSPTPRRVVFVVSATIRRDVPLYGGCVVTSGQPAVGGAGYVDIINVGRPGTPLAEPVVGSPPQSLSAAIGELSARVLGEGGVLADLEQALDPAGETSLLRKVALILDNVNAVTLALRAQTSSEDRQTLLSKVHQLLDDLGATTGALRTELAGGGDTTALRKVHTALDQLNVALGETAGLLGENRPLVHETLESVAHAAQTVDRELLGALRCEFDRNDPGSLLGQVHAALDRVNGALADVQALTDTTGRLVAANRPVIERALANVADTTDQLRQASQEVLLNPSRLIWGPGTQREEQILVFQAARAFAEAARDLDLASSRLQSVLATLPADGVADAAAQEELRAIRAAVRGSFDRFEQAERALWEQLK